MTTNAKIGQGTTFSYGNASGGTSSSWTAIGEIMDVPFPTKTINKVSLETQASDTIQYITGLKDNEDLSLELVYEGDEYNTLEGMLGTDKDFKITLPDGDYISIQGFISSVGGSAPVSEKMMASITVACNVVNHTPSGGS